MELMPPEKNILLKQFGPACKRAVMSSVAVSWKCNIMAVVIFLS